MGNIFPGMRTLASAWAQARPQTPLIRFPIAVYSHRGGPLEGFEENTLPAFRNSARLGVDLLELDVQMTHDGQVVVFHDRCSSLGGGLQLEGTDGLSGCVTVRTGDPSEGTCPLYAPCMPPVRVSSPGPPSHDSLMS